LSFLEYVQERLPSLGHRNWILIADAAYPEQCAPGIETIVTNADIVGVTQDVMGLLQQSSHVRPKPILDQELLFLPELELPDLVETRAGIIHALKPHQPEFIDHEQILTMVADAAKTYRILVIKTPCTIPYTSVFLRLECGYWTAEQEQNLRDRIALCQE